MDNFPGFIGVVNDNISLSIQHTLSQQLFLTEIMSISDFDLRYKNNQSYIDIVHGMKQRVLVLVNFSDSMYTTYVDLVDMSLFCRNGLLYIEKNKLGNVNQEFQIKNIQVYNLIYKHNLLEHCKERFE